MKQSHLMYPGGTCFFLPPSLPFRIVHAAVEVIQPWEREASGVWLFGPYRADYYRLGDTSNPWSRGGQLHYGPE